MTKVWIFILSEETRVNQRTPRALQHLRINDGFFTKIVPLRQHACPYKLLKRQDATARLTSRFKSHFKSFKSCHPLYNTSSTCQLVNARHSTPNFHFL